ncbi:MAG: hypothetical protein EOO29_21010 [Comamonadaceae bacterium]|nr:MAG: hypothetical protein EOO29_21010 [Comamonadaceae bacterium]
MDTSFFAFNEANATGPTAVPSATQATDGRVGARRRTLAELSREFNFTAPPITHWVGQAAIDSDKPLPGQEGLNNVSRA